MITPGDDIPIVAGSALPRHERRAQPDIGEETVRALMAAVDAYIPHAGTR